MRKLNKVLFSGRLIEFAFEETDDEQRTALHLSILPTMPNQFILALVKRMKSFQLDQADKTGRRAVDYLVRTNVCLALSPSARPPLRLNAD